MKLFFEKIGDLGTFLIFISGTAFLIGIVDLCLGSFGNNLVDAISAVFIARVLLLAYVLGVCWLSSPVPAWHWCFLGIFDYTVW